MEENKPYCECCNRNFIDWEEYYEHICEHTECECQVLWQDPDE